MGILDTTLVVAGLVAVALKLRRRHTLTWLVRRQLDAFAVALVLYAVFPTHLVSARVNVARIENGEYRPVLHMFRQSTQPESAASLLPLLGHSDVRVRQGVAALLEHEREVLSHDVGAQASWRERDVATPAPSASSMPRPRASPPCSGQSTAWRRARSSSRSRAWRARATRWRSSLRSPAPTSGRATPARARATD